MQGGEKLGGADVEAAETAAQFESGARCGGGGGSRSNGSGGGGGVVGGGGVAGMDME